MGVKKFTSEVIKEGKRVRWPKRDVLIPSVITVLVIAVFAGLILLLEDYAGNTLIEIIKQAFQGMGK
jgi:preprotein translocase SecE subunit